VFLGKSNGQPWHPLTESGIYGVFKRYAKKAGISKSWNPHQWRHADARQLAQLGMNIGLISQVLGHSDVKVTNDFYGQFAVLERMAAFDKVKPDIECDPRD
jgi:site-specific recombinase XerD